VKKVGLFFGSFNPIHTGHLIIASYMQEELGLDKVIFVVSPQNPFKSFDTLWPEEFRLKLVQKAIENNASFIASDIEFRLPKPSFTFNTLSQLRDMYVDTEFVLIMGSDNLPRLQEWKNYEEIIRLHKIEVYERPGFEQLETFDPSITIHKTPLIEISASFIRQRLAQKKGVRYLVPDPIIDMIHAYSLSSLT